MSKMRGSLPPLVREAGSKPLATVKLAGFTSLWIRPCGWKQQERKGCRYACQGVQARQTLSSQLGSLLITQACDHAPHLTCVCRPSSAASMPRA